LAASQETGPGAKRGCEEEGRDTEDEDEHEFGHESQDECKKNAKMKMSTMLQMGVRCCRFPVYLGDQMKAAGAGRATIRRGP
jgi:hypothetical protein